MWYLGPFHCELGGGGAHCTPQLLMYSTGNPTSLCGTQVLFLKIPHFQVVEIRNLGSTAVWLLQSFAGVLRGPLCFFFCCFQVEEFSGSFLLKDHFGGSEMRYPLEPPYKKTE